MNLKRRHLTESQRAMVAGRLAKLPVGRPSDKAPTGAISDAEAAKALQVGERSVERAKSVQRDGTPELQAAVETGAVSVSAAADVATLPEDEQAEIVAKGEKGSG